MRWVEIAHRVWVVRHRALDLNVGLVAGDEGCLVVDTGFGERHGAELAAGARERTQAPWSVLLTHAHYDHVFGTAAFLGPEVPDTTVYAHPVTARTLAAVTEDDRRQWSRELRDEGYRALAERLLAATLVRPTHPVTAVTLDLGGRIVHIGHPGRGHTGGDLVAHVPDVATVFAGDLVEQGAPPQAGADAHPAEWPSTVDSLLALRPRIVVPGHGEPVGPDFVAAQRDELAARDHG